MKEDDVKIVTATKIDHLYEAVSRTSRFEVTTCGR